MLWPSGFLPASVMAAVVLQLAVVTVSSTEMPDALNQNDQLNIKGRLMAVDCNEGRLTTVDCVDGRCGLCSRRAVPDIADYFNSTVVPDEHPRVGMLPAGGLTAADHFCAPLANVSRLYILATGVYSWGTRRWTLLYGIAIGVAMTTTVPNLFFFIVDVAAVLTACAGLFLLAFNIHFKLEMCIAVSLAYWCSTLWIGHAMSTLAGSALVVVAVAKRRAVILFMDTGTAGTAVADADAPAAPAESDLDRVRRQIRDVDEDLTELRAEKRQANAKGDKITKAEIEARIDKKEELLKSLTDRVTGLEAPMGRGAAAAAPAAPRQTTLEVALQDLRDLAKSIPLRDIAGTTQKIRCYIETKFVVVQPDPKRDAEEDAWLTELTTLPENIMECADHSDVASETTADVDEIADPPSLDTIRQTLKALKIARMPIDTQTPVRRSERVAAQLELRPDERVDAGSTPSRRSGLRIDEGGDAARMGEQPRLADVAVHEAEPGAAVAGTTDATESAGADDTTDRAAEICAGNYDKIDGAYVHAEAISAWESRDGGTNGTFRNDFPADICVAVDATSQVYDRSTIELDPETAALCAALDELNVMIYRNTFRLVRTTIPESMVQDICMELVQILATALGDGFVFRDGRGIPRLALKLDNGKLLRGLTDGFGVLPYTPSLDVAAIIKEFKTGALRGGKQIRQLFAQMLAFTAIHTPGQSISLRDIRASAVRACLGVLLNGLTGVAVSLLGFDADGHPTFEFQVARAGLFELLAKKMITSANTRDNALRKSSRDVPARSYGRSGGGGGGSAEGDSHGASASSAAGDGGNAGTATGGGGAEDGAACNVAGDVAGNDPSIAGGATGGGHTRRAATGARHVDGSGRGGAHGGDNASYSGLRIAATQLSPDEPAPRTFGSALTNAPVEVMRIPKPQPVPALVRTISDDGWAAIVRWSEGVREDAGTDHPPGSS